MARPKGAFPMPHWGPPMRSQYLWYWPITDWWESPHIHTNDQNIDCNQSIGLWLTRNDILILELEYWVHIYVMYSICRENKHWVLNDKTILASPTQDPSNWRRTHRSFWHAVVSHPASIVIHAHVTEDFHLPAQRGGHLWTLSLGHSWGAHRSFWHAVVSQPASIGIHAHVTEDFHCPAHRGGHLWTQRLGQSWGCKSKEERGDHHLSDCETVWQWAWSSSFYSSAQCLLSGQVFTQVVCSLWIYCVLIMCFY